MTSPLQWTADTDSAQRAARVVALGALETVLDAESAVRKRDAESVHKLRVALRQLRSWLHTYRPCLDDTLHRRARHRLGKIAAATSHVRDLDVQIAWLQSERAALGDSRMAAARWIQSALKAERKKAWRKFRKVRDRKFRVVTTELRHELTFYRVKRDVRHDSDGATMREVSAKLLREQADALGTAFSRIRSADDANRLHRARILAKESRYNLYLLRDHLRDTGPLTDELARFQDIVGDLRDAQLLAHRVSREVTSVVAERTAILASELLYRPSGGMDFMRAIASSPFDASLALLFARLHDRISAASRTARSWLDGSAAARTILDMRAAAARLDEMQ
jgi:CHAD domain-containing protein